MKAARIRITTKGLAVVLGFPNAAEIVSAFQDTDDMAHQTISLIVRGAGEELPEGSAVKVMTLEEIRS